MISLNRRRFLQATAGFALMPLLSACTKKDPLAAQEIHWDRDMCARCRMVISERNHAAQVINIQTHENYKFDDIGCVILWFKEENITWKDSAKIWITDIQTSQWIDARTAFYTVDNVTPMAYGFGAHATKEAIEKGRDIISFDEMAKRVLKKGR